MSGFYNVVFGYNPIFGTALHALGLQPEDFERFRDAWLQDDPPHGLRIVVHTRCGGGNRESYAEVFERMRAHPHFIREGDCDYDGTYANFEFRIPDETRWLFDHVVRCAEEVGRRDIVVDNRSQREKWDTAIARLKVGPATFE
jgi:hypothetical protein